MKQLLQQYAAYNYWANQKLLDHLLQLPAEIISQETGGSFPDIFKTVLHLWMAESIWWQRLKLAEHVVNPAENYNGNFDELSKNVLKQSADWDQWVKNTSEMGLQHVFAYRNSKKEEFKQPVTEVLLHLFNHQSYHRGQVVSQLRIAGVDKIPSTDFIQYLRKKN